MYATLKNYRQSPRKVRLVADLVKGKSVPEAMILLKFEMRRAANPVAKLVASAVANATAAGERPEDLMVKNITVDKGLVATRFMPRAHGSASPIRHRMSHVTVTLAKRVAKAAKRKGPAKKKATK